jgi:hypothetical protein
MLCVSETALIVKSIEDGYDSDQTFIADTGASSHMVYSKCYLTNIQELDTKVTAAKNMNMQCTLKSDHVGNLQSEGRQVRVTLNDILYVPWLNVNLLAFTLCLKYPGVTFGGDIEGLGLSFRGKHWLIHGNGKLYAADIKPILKQHPMNQVSPEAANLAMTFDKFHKIMGHPNNVVIKETAKAHSIQLTDVHHRPCQHCAKAKIRMKNIPKENDIIAIKKGERQFIDISRTSTATYAYNRYWLLVMDEYTNFLRYFLMKTKDETKHHVIHLILDLQKVKNIEVKFIRCDNSE